MYCIVLNYTYICRELIMVPCMGKGTEGNDEKSDHVQAY